MKKDQEGEQRIFLRGEDAQELGRLLGHAGEARVLLKDSGTEGTEDGQAFLRAHCDQINNFLGRTPLNGDIRVGTNLSLRATGNRSLGYRAVIARDNPSGVAYLKGIEYIFTPRTRPRR